MPRWMTALAAIMVLLMGCTEPGTYPITGEPCDETDSVHSLDSVDCPALPSGGGAF